MTGADEKPCQARRYADTMICAACSLQWDAVDADRPLCAPVKRSVPARAKAPVKYATAEDFSKLRERLDRLEPFKASENP